MFMGKERNAKAWKRARVQGSKLLVQSHNGDDFVYGKVQFTICVGGCWFYDVIAKIVSK